MDGLIHRCTRSLRIFSKKPWFSITVVGMLAAGIAGNTAVFCVVNSLFLRPLPFAESERLIDLDETAPQWNLVHVGVSNPDLHQWRTQNSTFESMAFFRSPSSNLSVGSTTERILSAQVTHDMLDVLRLRPLLGRNFNEEEDRPGGAAVALLSYGLWQRMFSGNRAVLGEAIKVDDQPYTVIGVLPPEAVFPDRAELWVPLAADPNLNSGYYANGIGRLRPGVAVQQAQADLLRIHRAMIAQGRTINEITSPILLPLRDRYLGDLKAVSRVLLGAVLTVLLIACVNISSLMMVHGSGRSRELAIRTALGASRRRIAAQLFAESSTLALIGGIIGILAGAAGLRTVIPFLSGKLPQWISFSFDGRVVLFCFAVNSAAAVLFGLLPAFQSSRVDVRGSLQDVGARATPPRRQRQTLNAFVVCEISLALMLSIAAGLLVRAFRKVMRVDPGFRPENVLTFLVRIPDSSYHKPEQKIAYYDRVLERLQALPGIKAAGATSSPPLGGQWGGVFEAEGGRGYNSHGDNPTVLQVAVTPGYFRAIGMTFLEGRGFEQQDGEPKSRPVAIVNETFVKHFWNGGSPVGRRIRRIGASDWLEVISMVRDERHYGLDRAVLPSVFLPYPTAMATALRGDERALQEMCVVLRSSTDPDLFAEPARDILRHIDPDIPMYGVQTMVEKLDQSLWTREAYSWLFGIFALVSISLGAAGVYGTVSYGVGMRAKEIGVRMALGARREQVLAQVLFGGIRTTLLGVTAGLVAALGATNWLRSLLFGVNSRDPLIYAAVVFGVMSVALLATFVPARRAATVDPVMALRYE
jgi:putative ABC transport system permease protein